MTAQDDPQRVKRNEAAAPRRDVRRNLSAFGLAQIAVRLIGLAVVIPVARILSEEDFGRYTVALALAGMLSLLVQSGMGGYLVREGTQAPERLGIVLGHVLFLQTLAGVAAIGASALIGFLLDYDAETLITTVLLTAAAILVTVNYSQMAVLVSLKRVRLTATFSAAQAFVLAALTLLPVMAGAGPVGIGAANLATALVSFPVAHSLVRRHWHLRIRFQREGLKETFGVSTAFAASKVGQAIFTYIDAVLIQAINGNAAAAQYGVAYRLNTAVRMFPKIYAESLQQPMARLARTDRTTLADLLNRAASQLFILAVPFVLGGIVLAEPLIRLLFGDRYADSGPILAVLLLTLLVQFPRAAVIVGSLAVGLERRVVVAYGVTIVVNLTANAFLIPAYGPMGAAISMVISVPVFGLFMAFQLRRAGIALRVNRRWAKAGVAGLIMLAVVWLLADLPVVIPILVGAAVYLVALVALDTLDEADLDMLPGGKRLGWAVRSRRKFAQRVSHGPTDEPAVG